MRLAGHSTPYLAIKVILLGREGTFYGLHTGFLAKGKAKDSHGIARY